MSTLPLVPVDYAADYPPTDAGNAESFADAECLRVRFEARERQFFIFRDHWRRDDSEEVRRCAVDHLRARAAAQLAAGRGPAIVRKTIQRCESTRDITNMLAESHHLLHIFREQCDSDPFLIGVKNGVVDLRTGALRPADPVEFITRVVQVEYDPAHLALIDTDRSPCPTWDRTLRQVFPDQDVRDCHERASGYSITGDCSEKKWFLCYGTGSNGKGGDQEHHGRGVRRGLIDASPRRQSVRVAVSSRVVAHDRPRQRIAVSIAP